MGGLGGLGGSDWVGRVGRGVGVAHLGGVLGSLKLQRGSSIVRVGSPTHNRTPNSIAINLDEKIHPRVAPKHRYGASKT